MAQLREYPKLHHNSIVYKTEDIIHSLSAAFPLGSLALQRIRDLRIIQSRKNKDPPLSTFVNKGISQEERPGEPRQRTTHKVVLVMRQHYPAYGITCDAFTSPL
jgi:hypothetical protein